MKMRVLLALLLVAATAHAQVANVSVGGLNVPSSGGGGGGTPGGSNTQVQYNNAGSFGGITGATTADGASLTLVAPILGTPASGTMTNVTGLPIVGGTTGTLTVARGGTNCTSATITCFNNITGLSAAGTTGTTTTNVVFSTSPVLTTPNLGTPSTLVGTNISGTAANLTAGNVTTNANLTGVITSVGNATSIASQTGTGTKFVVDTSPTLVTPNIGAATGTSLAVTGSSVSSTFAPVWASGTGPGATNNAWFWSGQVSGTADTYFDNMAMINEFRCTPDQLNAGAHLVPCLDVHHVINGAAFQGSGQGIYATLDLHATTANTAFNASYTALNAKSYAEANDNGTNIAPSGHIYAIAGQALLVSGATFFDQLVGNELDVTAQTGSSVQDKIGQQIVQLSTDAVSASRANIGLSFNNGAATPTTTGWACGICVGAPAGYMPLASSAWIIGSWGHGDTTEGSTSMGTITGGFDLTKFTFTDKAIKSNGFSVDPSGNVVGASFAGPLNGTVGATTPASAVVTTLTAAGAVNLNASNNAATNIGTGSTTSAVSIGNGGNTVTIGAPLTIGGNAASAATWTTAGIRLSGAATTYTDTTATGTTTTEAVAAFPSDTVAASGTATITNLAELYLGLPVAGTNVTATNRYSLMASGPVLFQGLSSYQAGINATGGTLNFNINANFATNINSGTSNAIITIGNSGTTGKTVLAGLATGTAADVLCLTSGAVVILQAAGSCTISKRALKRDITNWSAADGLKDVLALKPVTFRFKAKNRDPNGTALQHGFIAEDVAAIDPKLALYDPDMKTPKGYRPEAMIAALVGAVQAQQAEIATLKAQVASLRAR